MKAFDGAISENALDVLRGGPNSVLSFFHNCG